MIVKINKLVPRYKRSDPKFAKQAIVLCIKLCISDYMPEI